MQGKVRTLLLFAIFIIGLLGAGLFFLSNPDAQPILTDAYVPPHIEADALIHDVGKASMESNLKDNFKLSNTGGELLRIEKVETSCGCTATELDKKELEPGDFTTLHVTLDTSLKLGPVTKTIDVFSNDPKTPKLTLTLKADIQAPKGTAPHGKIKVKDPLVLFKGECKTCHVDKGIGKAGQALFVADCGMCHGNKGQGGVAPGLLDADYEDENVRAYMRGVIANGAEMNPSMPPFSSVHGGPLSESQIDSLLTYLRYESKKYKALQTKP